MISHTVYGCSTTVSYVYSTFYPGNSSLSQPTTFRTLCAYGIRVTRRGRGGGGDHNDQHKSEIARGDRR